MVFEDAIKFADIVAKYKKWLDENNLKNEPETLLAFLYIKGYLKENNNANSN